MEMMKIGLFTRANDSSPILPGTQSFAGFKRQFETRESGILIPTPSEPMSSLVTMPPRKVIQVVQYNKSWI